MRTAAAILLALIFPPIGAFLSGLGSRFTVLATALTLVAIAVYFLLYAGVGLILYAITCIFCAAAIAWRKLRKK